MKKAKKLNTTTEGRGKKKRRNSANTAYYEIGLKKGGEVMEEQGR